MIALGVEAHVAVATNMLALTFMSVGGALPFLGKGVLIRSRLPASVALTIVGSGFGAFLLLSVPLKALTITIAVAMIGVAVFSLLNKNLGQARHDAPASRFGIVMGYVATFLLAIYGGFFSGGYVTMLTAVFVLLFGMTFLQAVATMYQVGLVFHAGFVIWWVNASVEIGTCDTAMNAALSFGMSAAKSAAKCSCSIHRLPLLSGLNAWEACGNPCSIDAQLSPSSSAKAAM